MQYDMVFEGGGAKGMAFVGALQELEVRGHTPARLLGTSAGSIMATFLAAGYNTQEMADALNEKQDGNPVFLGFLETPPALSKEEIQASAIRKLLDDVNSGFVPDNIETKLDDAIAAALATSPITGRLYSFIERGGFFSADNFLVWLKTKLNSGVYDLERGQHSQGERRRFGEMNLAQFHQATGVDLTLVAADTTASRLLVLNHHTAPDCPLVWGVRMSMSVPLLWHEVVWQPEWGRYRGEDISGNTMVDGGLLSNFPIELFISNDPQVTAVMGNKTTSDFNVLGFLIDETIAVPGTQREEPEKQTVSIGKLRTVRRISNLVNTMMQAHDKAVIDAFEGLVVRLPSKGYGTIEFDMSEARRNALVNAGHEATASYFDRLASMPPSDIIVGVDAPDRDGLVSTADRIAHRILSQ
jgi:predicted acylesterase/phospholipase RssA